MKQFFFILLVVDLVWSLFLQLFQLLTKLNYTALRLGMIYFIHLLPVEVYMLVLWQMV